MCCMYVVCRMKSLISSEKLKTQTAKATPEWQESLRHDNAYKQVLAASGALPFFCLHLCNFSTSSICQLWPLSALCCDVRLCLMFACVWTCRRRTARWSWTCPTEVALRCSRVAALSVTHPCLALAASQYSRLLA